MKLIAYSILLASALSASVPAQSLRKPRVVDASNADITDFPYITTEESSYGGSSNYCGGVLITSRHILTSARCASRLSDRFDLSKISTGYGSVNLDEVIRGDNLIKKISLIRRDASIKSSDYVLAIYELSEPVDSTVTSFAKLNDYLPDKRLKVAHVGWGDRSNSSPKLLQRIDELISYDQECDEAYKNAGISSEYMICTKPAKAGSTCIGEEGGPLSKLDIPGNPVVGIRTFSNSSPDYSDCSKLNSVGLYIDVHYYIDIISIITRVPLELITVKFDKRPLEEKDIEIQKITGFKKGYVPPKDGSTSSTSTTSSSTTTTSSSTSTTSSSASTTSSSASTTSSSTSTTSPSTSTTGSPASTTSPSTSTTSSSTSTTSSSTSTTSPSTSTTGSPASTTSPSTSTTSSSTSATSSSTTTSKSIETPLKKSSFCSTGVLLDDGNGNITNCSKDDKVCGLNSQKNYDCVNETYYKRFCIQNDILVYGENGSVRDCTLERKRCGKNSQGLSTCIDKEPSKNTCDSDTILNYNNGTTVNCASSYRVCAKNYSEGFACNNRYNPPPSCILGTMLIVGNGKVRDCAHVGQTCGKTPEGDFDCIDI
ncbi:hypothetical protein AYI70_g5528 [Smittium culicis]|uniref:Peptidase S1 domain-containing protein n=1 Tax=Smittium culicis TaxID=133412 RepID=A0A1R1XU53_9FUNG|nr:hypothetical protein AYI70_g5528 [Smittium culicis]